MSRVDLGEVLDRREDVGQAAAGIGHRLAVRGDDAGGVGTGRLDRHLLAQHDAQRPARARRRCAGCVVRAPSRPAHVRSGSALSASTTASGSASRSSSRRQRAIAVGEVAEVVQHQRAPHVVGFRCEADDSVARRQSQCSPVRTVAHLLHARAPRTPRGGRTIPRMRTGCGPVVAGTSAPAATASPRPNLAFARWRNAVGVRSHTARIVSLNCRMDENPAANATSPNGSSVVSMSTRAV